MGPRVASTSAPPRAPPRSPRSRPAAAPTRLTRLDECAFVAHEHVSPKLDLIAGVTDPESFPLEKLAAGAILQVLMDGCTSRDGTRADSTYAGAQSAGRPCPRLALG